MNPNLFVYGTLLSGARHPKGDRLRREAVLLGNASFAGSLYRIAHYPGLVEGSDPEPRVHGEVYALNDPSSALKWLDSYEGIVAENPGQNDYERVERQIELASGATVTAWVYLYRKDVSRSERIADGRWTPKV